MNFVEILFKMEEGSIIQMFSKNDFFLLKSTIVSFVVVFGTVYLYSFLFGSKKKKALDPEVWKSFPLIEIEQISHDVKKFRFELPTPNHIVGLPIGQHISLKFVDKVGNEVQRSYTPTSSDDEAGFVDFVVKIYPILLPKFPNGGKLSLHLDSLVVGDTILMKGPKGKLEYLGCGSFNIKKRSKIESYKMNKIGMIAGGTGITPMLQVIHAIMKNRDDNTEVWLIFANQTEEDILLRKELDALPKDRVHVWYTLDRPPTKGWKYSSGYITEEMCREHLPPPIPDSMIFLCGPPPMIENACSPALSKLGFVDAQVFTF